MKVLFDHNVPYGLRNQLMNYEVSLADELGWARIANGELLRAGEEAGFEVMVTCDQNLSYQQNLTSRKLALVVLDTNNWKILKASTRMIVEAIDNATSGSFCYLTIATLGYRNRKEPNLGREVQAGYFARPFYRAAIHYCFKNPFLISGPTSKARTQEVPP